MLLYDPHTPNLPTAEDLPCSDDTPVDNEWQNLIPNLLLEILARHWGQRDGWFFGVDMGIYYDPNRPAVVPDGFLSLGVSRFRGEAGRLSYVLWEEGNVIPIFTLEVISKTYGQEYEAKRDLYADLGIRYYAIYRPMPNYWPKRQPLEIYRLENGEYLPMLGERIWLPEIGLALGREINTFRGYTREWLYWYTETGERLMSAEEAYQQSQQSLQETQQELEEAQLKLHQAKQEADRLAAKLRELGIDPGQV
ncbi:Uma2 family endonuclease [Synechococcus sp. PCC 6312]|uniref:Uma2 family endonuclease n=1 Tax=Synechococcus sp. (strain ATCC 27167 / PCC 6312) TaxID=195253 RepID=UPI00029F2F8E|nr:Uma2 family endonuclease [Synechococcus sp. PCC 6312]AFY60928.1 hypothetical protein Syn6312_1782 [Synechococcus sp. PCC 6312]